MAIIEDGRIIETGSWRYSFARDRRKPAARREEAVQLVRKVSLAGAYEKGVGKLPFSVEQNAYEPPTANNLEIRKSRLQKLWQKYPQDLEGIKTDL